ncbi:MAG: hypothetical protein OMM_14033 [Candidatus Magnetoglobus multicellularis str. Araruama]|uniref:Uncharacterized protein n=1 Tax=Candidatus Magnetoglobus multicellularis str. Araruama TaxID=890399 RepID=A0A1V1NSM4_9BACT|nr:MAG: hypothetical protein OMM_14033 [Candidatus Magnetoglobus multicellularis str. Araruama]
MACHLNNGIHPKNGFFPTFIQLDNIGHWLKRLQNAKASLVYGIEISPQLVAKATQENSEANIQYFCENPTRLQFLTYHKNSSMQKCGKAATAWG